MIGNLNVVPFMYHRSDESHIKNVAAQGDYFNRLRQLATSVFKWTGLPDTCNARYLEDRLFWNGFAAFCYMDDIGLITAAGGMMEYNIYDEPIKFQATNRSFTKIFDYDHFVLCRNNIDCIPTSSTIAMFASRLAECERTLDNNIIQQKTPYIIHCSDKNKLSWENFMASVRNNEPAIYVNKNFTDEIEVLPTNTPFIADKLLEYKHSIWAEALTFLGINNVNFEKSQHLLEAEVNANKEHVSTSAKAMLDFRQQCAEEVNRRYGTNIGVEFNIAVNRITDETANEPEADTQSEQQEQSESGDE